MRTYYSLHNKVKLKLMAFPENVFMAFAVSSKKIVLGKFKMAGRL